MLPTLLCSHRKVLDRPHTKLLFTTLQSDTGRQPHHHYWRPGQPHMVVQGGALLLGSRSCPHCVCAARLTRLQATVLRRAVCFSRPQTSVLDNVAF